MRAHDAVSAASVIRGGANISSVSAVRFNRLSQSSGLLLVHRGLGLNAAEEDMEGLLFNATPGTHNLASVPLRQTRVVGI